MLDDSDFGRPKKLSLGSPTTRSSALSGQTCQLEVDIDQVHRVTRALSQDNIPVFIKDMNGDTHMCSFSSSKASQLDHKLTLLDNMILSQYYVEYVENRDLTYELSVLSEREAVLRREIECLRQVIWPCSDLASTMAFSSEDLDDKYAMPLSI